jgi:hypothetical protein
MVGSTEHGRCMMIRERISWAVFENIARPVRIYSESTILASITLLHFQIDILVALLMI